MRKIAGAAALSTVLLATPASGQTATGDLTLKTTSEGLGYRLNLVASYGPFVVGTRDDAPFSNHDKGYGLDFARVKLLGGGDEVKYSVQGGVSGFKLSNGDYQEYGHLFGIVKNDTSSLVGHVNQPLHDEHDVRVFLEGSHTFSHGFSIRGALADRPSKPNTDLLELEVRKDIGNGWYASVMRKQSSTPRGYERETHVGFGKRFNYKVQHRK